MRWGIIVLLAGCGRVGFDVKDAGPGGGGTGDARLDAVTDAATLPVTRGASVGWM